MVVPRGPLCTVSCTVVGGHRSKLLALRGSTVGGEGRNRTDECSFCRAVPYHLATPPPKESKQYGCRLPSQVKLVMCPFSPTTRLKRPRLARRRTGHSIQVAAAMVFPRMLHADVMLVSIQAR